MRFDESRGCLLSTYFLYVVLGLGAGALYSALAQAVVVGYRGSGLINFAQGAMAMIVAYIFSELRLTGRLLIMPLPNPLKPIEGIAHQFGAGWDLPSIPSFIKLGHSFNFWPALLIALVYAAILGALIHLLIYRALRAASTLSKIVASVGVMLTLQAIAALRFGTDSRSVPPMLPQGTITVLGRKIPEDRLILAAISVGLAIVLTMVYRKTKFGMATEAAASEERGAVVSGLNPDRLALINWVVSSVIGGVIGILFASVTNISPTNFTLFVIPALGAALLGNLSSFPIAACAGLGIGIAQSLTIPLQAKFSWFPQVGAAEGVPFLVIIVAMIVMGKKLPVRGAILPPKMPFSPEPKRVLATSFVIAIVGMIMIVVLPFDLRGGLINTLSATLLTLSLVVVTGMAGQASLMQLSIAGMSAIAMTRFAGDWGIPFPLSPLLAALVGMLFGVVASLPAMRIRGVHLAIVTLAAATAFSAMVLGNGSIVRPTDAANAVPPPKIGGLEFGINSAFPIGKKGVPSAGFGLFLVVLVVLCCGLVANVRRSRTGRALLAVRANERSAAALGISVPSMKVAAFALGAFLAGLAGAVNAYRFQGVNTSTYSAIGSVSILAVAYLAGISSISGAIAAGVISAGGFLTVLIDRFFHLGRYEVLVGGVGLIIMAVRHPDGLVGMIREDWHAKQARKSAAAEEPESVVAESFETPMLVEETADV